MNWKILAAIFLLYVSTTHAIGYYYENRGYYTADSCPVAPCPNCPKGQYMRDCAGFSTVSINGLPPGYCTPCTAVANSYFTSHGFVTDSCPFICNEGYFDSGGRCSPKIYVVQFQVAVTLASASTFNVRKYIASMASLAGVSVFRRVWAGVHERGELRRGGGRGWGGWDQLQSEQLRLWLLQRSRRQCWLYLH